MIYNQCLLLRNGGTAVPVESRCLDRVVKIKLIMQIILIVTEIKHRETIKYPKTIILGCQNHGFSRVKPLTGGYPGLRVHNMRTREGKG